MQADTVDLYKKTSACTFPLLNYLVCTTIRLQLLQKNDCFQSKQNRLNVMRMGTKLMV